MNSGTQPRDEQSEHSGSKDGATVNATIEAASVETVSIHCRHQEKRRYR